MSVDYITKLELRGVRNIPEVTIELPTDKRTHLIITGPNGSGKTTLINMLYDSLSIRSLYLQEIASAAKKSGINSWQLLAQFEYLMPQERRRFENFCSHIRQEAAKLLVKTNIVETPEYHLARANHLFLVYKSEAHRQGKFNTPAGPKALPDISTGEQFIQLLVNMKTQQAYLFEDMNTQVDPVKKVEAQKDHREIVQWFQNVHNALARLFGHSDFYLDYDRKRYNYSVVESGKEPYGFTQLSDGYSAILKIVTDLMLQMSTNPLMTYASPGIAIIDEIETHLHVELQQKILPFLTEFFPNIQFIVTTHSPFVLSSIDNAVIFDMKSHSQYQDFSRYSYSGLIEGYFNVSQYSSVIIEHINRAEGILSKDNINEEERQFIIALDNQISQAQDFQPLELKNRWLCLKLKHIHKFNG